MRSCVVCEKPISGQKQKYCSNACKQKDHWHRVKAQTNTYHSQTIRSLRRKLELIDLFGGSCARCGYSKNISALHFHHLDANLKEFKLDSRILSNRNWESILAEVSKCELLCSNCHAEEHNPELGLHNVQEIVSGASAGKRADEQGVNSGKPYQLFPFETVAGNPEPSRENGSQCIPEGAETKK
jgi:hypothetical protein